MIEGERIIYVCPDRACVFVSMMPGRCRSHPYPCRAMGPVLVALKVAPSTDAEKKAQPFAAVSLDNYERGLRGLPDG